MDRAKVNFRVQRRVSYVRRGGKLGGCWLFTELPGFPCGNFWRLYNYFKRKSNINGKANLVQPLHRATSEHAPRGIRRASSARRSRVNREEVGGARRGGAAPRTRSPAARRAPPAGGACAVSAEAAPLHRPRGSAGSLGPSARPSFPAVGGASCGPLPSRLASRAPSESPARRGRSRAARTSRLRRLRRRRRPRASLPPAPGSGECLASCGPSVHSGALASVLSVVPRAPLSVCPSRPRICPQPGRAAAPPSPGRQLCVCACCHRPVPSGTSVSKQHSAPWDARSRGCPQFESCPHLPPPTPG